MLLIQVLLKIWHLLTSCRFGLTKVRVLKTKSYAVRVPRSLRRVQRGPWERVTITFPIVCVIGMVWCGVVWCGMVWYGMVWDFQIRPKKDPLNTLWCNGGLLQNRKSRIGYKKTSCEITSVFLVYLPFFLLDGITKFLLMHMSQ